MIVLGFVVRVIAMMSPGDSWVARWQRIGMLGDIAGHHHTPYQYQYSIGASQHNSSHWFGSSVWVCFSPLGINMC